MGCDCGVAVGGHRGTRLVTSGALLPFERDHYNNRSGSVTRVAPDEHVSLQIDHNHLIQQRMGSSIFADLPPLQPSTHYELRINYPATVSNGW